MLSKFSLATCFLFGLLLAGCGPRPVTGGTTGTLRAGGELLGEIQVNVHKLEGSTLKLIGFGVTREDGTFQLVQPGAAGNLWLNPGEYRFTVESVGAPYAFPDEYTKPETTPLKTVWPSSGNVLALEIPAQFVP